MCHRLNSGVTTLDGFVALTSPVLIRY